MIKSVTYTPGQAILRNDLTYGQVKNVVEIVARDKGELLVIAWENWNGDEGLNYA